MKSTLLSRRDLDFLLYEWLRVDELTKRERFAEHSRETFDGVLDLCEQLATRYFAPHNKKSDANEPSFDGEQVTVIAEVKEAWDAFAAGRPDGHVDGPASSAVRSCPSPWRDAGFAWFPAANVSTTGYLHADHGQRQPAGQVRHAGADRGVTCSRCSRAGSPGRWRCRRPRRARRWPTSSPAPNRRTTAPTGCSGPRCGSPAREHELTENIVNLVLAKIPGGPPGTKGISLFIVPKFLVDADGSVGERNDVVLAGLNHKMGQRGITNTVLNFGDGTFTPGGQPGAVGYLVGEPHRGLAYMFTMMNEARLGVGMGAVALGYTGYLKSLEYARERPQGRPRDWPRTRRRRRCRSSSMPTSSECCWRRRRMSRAGWRCCCTAPGSSTCSTAPSPTRSGDSVDAAARHPDAGRQELAVAVVPGGQQPRHPGARRLRLHPRVRRRTALPRQPAQPDPRGHPRHPEPGPVGPQGNPTRRRQPGRARRCDRPRRLRRPPQRVASTAELAGTARRDMAAPRST